MSFLLALVDLLLLTVVLYDTLGFIAHNRKDPQNSNQQDYSRICFTWIFYLAVRSVVCSSCTGYMGSFLYLLSIVFKAYISLPVLHGTEKLYNVLIEQNVLRGYFEKLSTTIKDKVVEQKKEN